MIQYSGIVGIVVSVFRLLEIIRDGFSIDVYGDAVLALRLQTFENG